MKLYLILKNYHVISFFYWNYSTLRLWLGIYVTLIKYHSLTNVFQDVVGINDNSDCSCHRPFRKMIDFYYSVSFAHVFLEFYNFEVFILFLEEIQRSKLCMLL